MAHQVFRRGIFGGDTSPYAPIVATSPDLLIPLLYASTAADGQILFQDAACTVAVTTAGDPVGGVKWDGTIVATQSTDANRPVWQGEARGVAFDKSSQQRLAATFPGLSGDNPVTIIGSINPTSYGGGNTQDGTVWRIGDITGSAANGEAAALALESSASTWHRLFGSAIEYDPLPLTEHVFTSRYTGSGAQWTLREDGTLKTVKTSGGITANFTTDGIAIGGISSYSDNQHYGGDIKALGFYGSALNDTDRSAAETAFMGL